MTLEKLRAGELLKETKNAHPSGKEHDPFFTAHYDRWCPCGLPTVPADCEQARKELAAAIQELQPLRGALRAARELLGKSDHSS